MVVAGDITAAAWYGCEDEICAAVENVVASDSEFSARLLYRRSRALMRRLGVGSPVELYYILRQIYWNADSGVRLGDHLSVGFGVTDRRRQVRDYVARHPGEPKNILAMGYEHEYGFSAGIAEIWIDLFAEFEDVAVSEWLGRVPMDDDAAKTFETIASEVKSPCSPSVDIAMATSPAFSSMDLDEFFARELRGDICDAELVRRRYAFEIGDADFTQPVSDMGYYEDHGLLFKCGQTPNEHFTRLIRNHPSFARGDSGFEDAVWRHPTFRYVLGKMLEVHTVFLYEPDSYLAFTRLHDVLGMRMADVESYAASVSVEVPDHAPFTVASLHADGLRVHPLDALEMPDAFYEGLLDASGFFRSCIMAGTRVFCLGGDGRMSAGAVIDWLVEHNEGIERVELPRLICDELGIRCSSALLTVTLRNSSVYYDDIGDAYYSSIDEWKKEARNELA